MHDRPRIRALRDVRTAAPVLPVDPVEGAGLRVCSGKAGALRARPIGWPCDEARATLDEAAPARRLEAAE